MQNVNICVRGVIKTKRATTLHKRFFYTAKGRRAVREVGRWMDGYGNGYALTPTISSMRKERLFISVSLLLVADGDGIEKNGARLHKEEDASLKANMAPCGCV